MSRLTKALCLVGVLALVTPALGVYSELQVSVAGLSGTSLTLSVHNPNSGPETARLAVTVRLDDGSVVSLTSPNLTVNGGATVPFTVNAARTLSGIEDGPEPIPGL